jgi:hypothetical protein
MNRYSHPVEPEEVMSYLDGELEPGRAAAVAVHLEECPECQALTGELRVVSRQMANWQVESPPDRLDERVNTVLQEEMMTRRKKSSAAEAKRRPVVRGWVWGLAGGLAVFLVVVSVSIPNLYRSRMATSRPARPGEGVSNFALGPPRPSSPESALVAPAPQEQVGGAVPGLPAGPMIVRTAMLTIVTKEFDNGRAAVELTVRRLQGYMEQLRLNAPSGAGRVLTATLRVPADRMDPALVELRKLGRVEQESQTGEEVTRQYVDLVARLGNARNTEQRLIEVLRQRTGRVADILAVEQEIARVRGEIERMEAQRKGLETQVSFATVQLHLQEEHTAALEVAPPSTGNRLWNDLVAGYHTLAESALGLLAFLLRYGPTLLFWLVILFWPARRVWRHLRAAAQ